MNPTKQKWKQGAENELPDEDRDSLHTLAISILPVNTPIFRRARLVKNSRLDSVIEFFNSVGCGRGQMELRYAGKFLALPEKHPDVELLQKVGMLPSFDVYSLRIQLRGHGIVIPDGSALTLSPGKIESLSAYMATFTRPLVAEIFGRDTQGEKFRDIVG